LLASRYPFFEIIGVEFSTILHRIAQNNIAIYRDRRQKCSRIRSICLDAVEYIPPAKNLVTFFFNPFDGVVFADVLSNVQKSHTKDQKVFLIYCQARCSSLIEESGFLPYQRRLALPSTLTIRPGWISSLNLYSNCQFT
jgi:hypothetical protein